MTGRLAISSAVLVLCLGPVAKAQDNTGRYSSDISLSGMTSERVLRFDSELWSSSMNPASLTIAAIPDYGMTQLGGNYTGGSFKRAQEFGSMWAFGANSEKYYSFDKLRVYGHLGYTQERQMDKRWSDNIDPYNGNPYIAGSELPGNYTHQKFDFSVKMASIRIADRIRCGLGADYSVADFSRLNDPRSRVQSADYGLTPGIVADLGRGHRIGAAITWDHHKEKTNKLVAKGGTIDKYSYIAYKGLAEYSSIGILFFTRRYVGDKFGGNLQYSFDSSDFSILGETSYKYRVEAVSGESDESPGNYRSSTANASVSARFNGDRFLHTFHLNGDYSSGDAEEFVQEQVTEINKDGIMEMYWKTLMANVRYRNSSTDVHADWRMYERSGDGFKWYCGASADASMVRQEYILPESFCEYAKAQILLQGGYTLFSDDSHSLLIQGEAGYLHGIPIGLSLNQSLEKNGKTVLRDNVIIPDYSFAGSRAVPFSIEVKYAFKARKTTYFIAAYTRQYHNLSGPGSRCISGLSIGLL